MRKNKRSKDEGALDPPCQGTPPVGVPMLRAANDNGRGRRAVILKNFENVPMLIDEIAVIDRLMQDAPAAANDNWTV